MSVWKKIFHTTTQLVSGRYTTERRRILTSVLGLGLLLALVAGVTLAQEPDPPEGAVQPQGALSVTGSVASTISYQGMLTENGSPVDGSRNMIFRLYSDDACSTQVGSDIDAGSVPVNDGFFDVDLPVDQDDFNGQALWLEAEVDGTEIGCEEIQPVPYALSLRPGAVISDTSTSIYVGFDQRRGSFPLTADYGILVETRNGLDHAVYGSAHGSFSMGVGGSSDNALGYGVYGNNTAGGVDIMAGGSGIIQSTAETEIAVSPLKTVVDPDLSGNPEVRPGHYGTVVLRPSAAGTQYAYVPVDLVSQLFGVSQTLKSITVCYDLDTASSYIGGLSVYYTGDDGGRVELISDSTNRTSTAWECYTASASSPAVIGGPVFIRFNLVYSDTGSSHDIQIGKIILTLVE